MEEQVSLSGTGGSAPCIHSGFSWLGEGVLVSLSVCFWLCVCVAGVKGYECVCRVAVGVICIGFV